VLEELADHAADRERDALGPGMPHVDAVASVEAHIVVWVRDTPD
jgi:hypothetical protein